MDPKTGALTAAEMRILVKAAIEQAGSMRALSRALDLNVCYISEAARGKRTVGRRLAAALGFRRWDRRAVEYLPTDAATIDPR